MSNENGEMQCPSCEMDDEAAILIHAIDYMNESDERARQRFLFLLIHRYFEDWDFTPKRPTVLSAEEKQ